MTTFKDTKEAILATWASNSNVAYDTLLDDIGLDTLVNMSNHHTRLMTAIENYLKDHVNDAQSEKAYEKLKAAWEAGR